MLVAVSFTQDSAKELKTRIIKISADGAAKRVMCGTFHSLALKMLQDSGGRRMRVINGGEAFALLRKAMSATNWPHGWDSAVGCLEQAKATLGPLPSEEAKDLLKQYDQMLANIGAIDFGSMLQRCVAGLRSGAVKPLPAAWLLVDEAQDMDEVQLEWVKAHARTGVSVTMVGDDDQCHPADVLVSTADGSVPIGELYYGGGPARLLTPKRRSPAGSSDTVVLRAGNHFRAGMRPYEGTMVSVAAGGHTTPCTPNHRWYVRWAAAARSRWAVYLMRSAAGWTLFSGPIAPAQFWPTRRMRECRGTGLWILDSAVGQVEAERRARNLRTAWGLPNSEESGDIDPPANVAMTARAVQVLKEFGLFLDFPFMGNTRQKFGPNRGLVVTAANLLTEVMEVPAQSGALEATWKPISQVSRSLFAGEVYSLSVPGELYVAGGLVTHNSIYGWRYACGIDGMESFEKEMRASRVLLQSNYRSAPEIVDLAKKLIVNNRNRLEKAPRPTRTESGSIELCSYPTRKEEADAILSCVRDEPDRWAVLARTNSLLKVMQATVEGQVPYSMSGGGSVWETALAGCFRGLLLDVDKGDRAGSMIQALMMGKILDGAGVAKLNAVRDPRFEALMPQIEAHVLQDGARRRHAKAVTELRELWPSWISGLRQGHMDLVIYGVAGWLKELVVTGEDDRELVDFLVEAILRRKGSMPARFIGLGERADPGEGLTLVTMHSAKGLEFDCCWIMAAEDGVCPNLESELEEERRLFYVAMTRARYTLIISHTLEKDGKSVTLSRFLREAGLVR